MNVARNREPGQHLKQIAADFGISESCLTNWMKAARVADEVKPGTTAAENADLPEARKRIRLLEQENEVLRALRPICRRRTCRENDAPMVVKQQREPECRGRAAARCVGRDSA